MAEKLKTAFDTNTKLIPGSGGVFDITVDGVLIFSKHKEWRFPEADEIIGRIREM